MRDELLTYYERELAFIRRMAGEFADKYPKIAGRLLLERGKCEDPHVERLIESFALLAACRERGRRLSLNTAATICSRSSASSFRL